MDSKGTKFVMWTYDVGNSCRGYVNHMGPCNRLSSGWQHSVQHTHQVERLSRKYRWLYSDMRMPRFI